MTATLDYVRQLAVSNELLKLGRKTLRAAKRDAGKQWWETGPHRHRGVDYYDNQRLGRQLPPMPATSGDGYAAAPSWASLPDSWGEWKPAPANSFHSTSCAATESAAIESATVIAESSEYRLSATAAGTGFGYWQPSDNWKDRQLGKGEWLYQATPWQLTFADGSEFYFASRAVAEAALDQLLKIRRAKHPKPDTIGKRAPSPVYFTSRRLRDLPADAAPEVEPADDTELQDVAA